MHFFAGAHIALDIGIDLDTDIIGVTQSYCY